MKQVLSASKKVNTTLKDYNAVPPHSEILPNQLQRSEVVALDADVWQYLAPIPENNSNVPHLMQRKLIDTANLNQRSEEESKIIVNDMGRLVRALNRQQTKVSSELRRLDDKSCLTPFEKGSMALLMRRLLDILACQKTVTAILSKVPRSDTVSIQEFVAAVDSQLNRDTQTKMSDLPEVSMEAIQEMVEAIKALEDESAIEEDELDEGEGEMQEP